MNSNYDANLVYQFLINTPESALRKMLVEKTFTEVHFNMMMKILRSSNETQFCDHFYNSTYPKAKFNGNEINLKEKFWNDCIVALNTHGLLSPAQKTAA
ncbi:MAG: hypothetical protein A2622_03060 [Bdellovibrionales bacterium RIFCSPHIGHO2_01_FULL_40_29]|nr:MAG: hypothetical protein A2622_03060 [Bdellovibrionales bacterium RIFCSPHIGHO2_01_FULL_40_29]OFZ34053.1 MAG: hypothetical protein A3D17_03480 [Bdellovibrionales bacterium RIFCSPHIGHO2_02_FULL_40_15]